MGSITEDVLQTGAEKLNILNRSQSLVWRLIHGTLYMLGGLCFLVGSSMYFTDVSKRLKIALELGGWMFTIGSTCFLFTDVQEWWFYRIGCFFDDKYLQAFEATNIASFLYSPQTFIGQMERSSVGMNYFLSVCGSIFYLIGSILFIPIFERYLETGEWLFIAGSAMIFLSQVWKVYRSASTNLNDQYDHRFRLSNLLQDILSVSIDTFAGIGGLFYLLGSILFLPYINTKDHHQNRATLFFICGSIGFILAGFFNLYRYYRIETQQYKTVSLLTV